MSYTATIKFSYINDTETTPSKYFPEIVDKQTITVEAPAQDLNMYQYYELFKNFVRACGFTDYQVMDGACRIAFNESNDPEQMKKLAGEYELFLAEEFQQKLEEYDNQQDEELKKLEAEIRGLKAKLSRFENPGSPQYTESELDAMLAENPVKKKVTKKVLDKAYQVCNECGEKYGTYSVGCSSRWLGGCDVCGKNNVPVTEKRDYNYLQKGIVELSK